jgi:hypothetical protein
MVYKSHFALGNSAARRFANNIFQVINENEFIGCIMNTSQFEYKSNIGTLVDKCILGYSDHWSDIFAMLHRFNVGESYRTDDRIRVSSIVT